MIATRATPAPTRTIWPGRAKTQALPPILNPRDLFERLFGDDAHLSPEARARRNRFRRSILDFVREDTRKLQGDLGPTDRRKLDEYLTSVRSIEQQIEKAEAEGVQVDPGMDKPYGVPADFAEHFKLMTDMITVAFQADLSRVVTFLVTREGTSRPYREIGIPDGHHPLTHHRYDPERMEKVVRINRYHIEQFAAWVRKLKAVPEGDSTLLDNSMIVYGAGLSDGNLHTHDDPADLGGGQRRGISSRPAGESTYRKETPMSNLFLTMMDRMGVHAEHFGDSTSRLPGLDPELISTAPRNPKQSPELKRGVLGATRLHHAHRNAHVARAIRRTRRSGLGKTFRKASGSVFRTWRIFVESEPSIEQLRSARVPRGGTLLGLYQGVPLLKRSVHYGMVLPDRVTLFQGPIERSARRRDENPRHRLQHALARAGAPSRDERARSPRRRTTAGCALLTKPSRARQRR